MSLEFDPKTHTYRIEPNGRVIPSVTQIIEGGGLSSSKFYTEGSADRGKWLHEACSAFDEKKLDWLTVPAEWLGYVEAYCLFLEQSGFFVELSEKALASERLWFCGTLDRAGHLNNKPFVIDIKTGAPAPWHRLQTAGYAILISETGGVIPNRAALYLNKNGKYKLVTHSKPEDLNEFMILADKYNGRDGQ